MDIIFPSMLTTRADVVGVSVDSDELLSLDPEDERRISESGLVGTFVGDGNFSSLISSMPALPAIVPAEFTLDFTEDTLLLCDGVVECDLSMGSL